jgi:type I restriction enzyme S subunit
MSTAPYQHYKESGIGWIKTIPSEWDVLPLYAVATECDESNKGMLEDNLLSLSYGRIVNKDINSNDGLLPESFETYQVVQPNDMVLRLTDLQNDKRSLRSAIVKERGIITSAYLALRPHGILPEYFSYLLRAYDLTKVFYSMGGGLRQSMKFSDIKRMPVLVPSLEEQQAIATFLDRETSKINALITEQEELIKLLEEKRQIVISIAVTKGLDSGAKLKNTGFKLLPEVPEHWEVRKIKSLASRISSGKTPSGGSEIYVDDGVIFLRSQNVYDEGLRLEEVVYITPEIDEQMASSRVRPGDILLNITGASIGRTCSVPNDFPSANVNQHVCVIRLNDPDYIPFVEIFFKSQAIKSQSDFVQNGAAREGLNFEQIGGMAICIPPLNEQLAIVEYVSHKFRSYTELINTAINSIQLLQERRSALISAAITGKIDLRSAVSEMEAA